MENVDLIIKGSTIITLDKDDRIISDGYLAIRGETIVALDSCVPVPIPYRGKRTIDAHDAIVMPGLINCHTHAAMTLFRGFADDLELMTWLKDYIFPAEAKNLSPEFVFLGSLLACAEMIKSGTTTFCDMYLFEEMVIEAARTAGMRCVLGEGLFDFPSPNAKNPREGLVYTQRLIEKFAAPPLINIIIHPHALYTCAPSLLVEAKRLADVYRLPYGLHLLETQKERQELERKLGKRAILFLDELGYLGERFIAYHCVAMDEEDIKMFSHHGCKVVHNPESNMKLASGVAPIPKMIKAGITVGLGTDGCASNNNLDLFQEMDSAAKLHKVFSLNPTVMDARTVVKMATQAGAKVLGLEKYIGSLEVGKKADIIIIDLSKPHLTPLYNPYSHLVYAVGGADVDTVIINGRIVMENRTLLTLKEKEILSQAGKIAQRIGKTLKGG